MVFFSRKEAAKLSGVPLTSLYYLDKVQIIVPYEMKIAPKTRCAYAWNQVIALKVCEKAKQRNYPLQTLRNALKSLCASENSIPKDGVLVITKNKAFWVEKAEYLNAITTGEYPDLLPVSFTIGELLEEIKEQGIQKRINRFSERFAEITDKHLC